MTRFLPRGATLARYILWSYVRLSFRPYVSASQGVGEIPMDLQLMTAPNTSGILVQSTNVKMCPKLWFLATGSRHNEHIHMKLGAVSYTHLTLPTILRV